MLASHKLDAWILPRDVNYVPPTESVSALVQYWRSRGVLHSQSLFSGLHAGEVFSGGFRQLVVVEADGVRFVANQQGGFRVFCDSQNVTSAFVAAMGQWRNGSQERVLRCPCGQEKAFEELEFRPHAGFYRFALEFRDLETSHLTVEASALLRKLLGEFHIVYRRVG